MNDDTGLDVSLEETAICVVDAAGAIVKEVRAESAPDALHDALKRLGLPLARVGMEACSLATWSRMAQAGVQLLSWFAVAVACELHRDWRNDVEGLGTLLANYIPDYRNPMNGDTAQEATRQPAD